MIKRPYLLFTGDGDPTFGAKTAQGVLFWRPEQCLAQHKLPAGTLDLGIPFMSLAEAYQAGARTLLIGVTNRGGLLPEHWIPELEAALAIGFDLASGLHQRLSGFPTLRRSAKSLGRQLHDVRHWRGADLPIATGNKRRGKRALMIGSDCAVGKKFSALAIEREMHAQGIKATFRATGQTGILIAGEGIAIDAVPGDFIAGAIEMLTPDNDGDHWDIIEGQASVLHPSFAGVTLALVHGAQPDAMVLCHEPGRRHVRGLPERALPGLEDTIAVHTAAARLNNPNAKVVGISLDTHRLDDTSAEKAVAQLAVETGLPTTDPLRFGAEPLVEAIVGQA